MAKADTSVKWFHSAQPDAPVLNGNAGSLISVLDACLLDGFSVRTPDSVTVADGVATVSISAGNPYEKHAVIVISGSNNVALNAEWRIDAAAASSFTFVCPGVANGVVTGASIKRAGAGWGKPFSDANVAAYQSLDLSSTQLYLKVTDTIGRYAQLVGYENMTGIDVGTGRFPTTAQIAAGVSWAKSDESNSTPKTWALFADGSIIYFYQATYGTTNPTVGAFGDLVSFVPGDKYACIIAGSSQSSSAASPGTYSSFVTPQGVNGVYVARMHDQSTVSQQWVRASAMQISGGNPFGAGISAPLGGQVLLRAPILASSTTFMASAIRGIVPGLIEPMHAAFGNISTAPFDGVGIFSGRMIAGYLVAAAGQSGSIAFDLTGPWR